MPGAEAVTAFDLSGTALGELKSVDARGLFEGTVDGPARPVKYRAQGHGAEWWITDPYSFGPCPGPLDDFLMGEGNHFRLYDKMGAHLIEHQGVAGVHFAVWAPNAERVAVVGDFNDWNPGRHVMRRRLDVGVWEIFIPDIGEGRAYKFAITGPHGADQPMKADPFAFAAELRPKTASVTTAPPTHVWQDGPTANIGRVSIPAACRSASMRCMPGRGTATKMAGT